MRTLFVKITLLLSVFAAISTSAQAEMVRCRTSPNGWCNLVPVAGQMHRPPMLQRPPAVMFRAGPVSLIAPAPVQQQRRYETAYSATETRSLGTDLTAVPAQQQSGEARCTTPDSKFVAELGRCVRSIAGNSAEAQLVSPDIARGDPMCRDKPAGFTYDKNVTGPNGEQGIDHRICGRRPN